MSHSHQPIASKHQKAGTFMRHSHVSRCSGFWDDSTVPETLSSNERKSQLLLMVTPFLFPPIKFKYTKSSWLSARISLVMDRGGRGSSSEQGKLVTLHSSLAVLCTLDCICPSPNEGFGADRHLVSHRQLSHRTSSLCETRILQQGIGATPVLHVRGDGNGKMPSCLASPHSVNRDANMLLHTRLHPEHEAAEQIEFHDEQELSRWLARCAGRKLERECVKD